MNFNDFKFRAPLARAVREAGFREPSPIQALAIPAILEGKDVVGQAHTGTGKTAAFALPILEKMKGDGSVEAVIIVPTRELAMQVADEVYKFSRLLNIRTATVYGGTSYRRQIQHIDNAGVIVATPGRFLDLLDSKRIDISPRFAVLDEADEMLNMGFLEDVRRIFTFMKNREQTLMFSATMPDEIRDLAETLTRKPEFIEVAAEKTVSNNKIKQHYYVVDEHERDDAIIRLIDFANPRKAIVFCRTKRETDRLADHLRAQGYKVAGLHGDMEQRDRRQVMMDFKKHKFEILVATDVAARGIDVRGVSHVFNYHIPFDPESYVHRIGRTGRANRDGMAMMLVTPHEFHELDRIQKETGSKLDLQEMPRSSKDWPEILKNLQKRISDVNIDNDLKKKFSEARAKSKDEEFSEKLFAAYLTLQTETSTIGKTRGEVEQLLKNRASIDETPSKSNRGQKTKNPRSASKRSNRSRGRHDGPVRRGTERGEVPIPTVETVGGSRIVARKLY